MRCLIFGKRNKHPSGKKGWALLDSSCMDQVISGSNSTKRWGKNLDYSKPGLKKITYASVKLRKNSLQSYQFHILCRRKYTWCSVIMVTNSMGWQGTQILQWVTIHLFSQKYTMFYSTQTPVFVNNFVKSEDIAMKVWRHLHCFAWNTIASWKVLGKHTS